MATINEWMQNYLKAPNQVTFNPYSESNVFNPISATLEGYVGAAPIYSYTEPGDGYFSQPIKKYYINGQVLDPSNDIYGTTANTLRLISSTPTPDTTTQQAMYQAVANGEIQVSPEDFNNLIIDANLAIDPREFAALSPEVQQWAKQNPQAFIQQMLAHRNPANDDLGSMGAEGGYSTPQNIAVSPLGQLDYSNAGYMDIHDDKNFFEEYGIPLALAGLGGYFLGPELLAGFGAGEGAAGAAALGDLSGVAGMGVADFATSSALTDAILANYAAGGAGLTGFEGALAGLGGLAEGAGTIGATMDELSLQELLDQALGPNYNADILESISGPVDQTELARILSENAQAGNISLSDVSKVYNAAKNIMGQSSATNTGLQGLANLLAGGYGAYAQSNLAGQQKDLAKYIIENADPYRQYRKEQEIPFMASMLGKAPQLMQGAEQTGKTAYDTLADLFYQNKLKESYTNPLAVYQSPEMQALSGQFMNQIARRDAAAGRTSQYGARALEGQNQFLTQALPAYRQGLVQGSGAQTQQGGALSNLFGQQGSYAQGIAKLGMPSANTAGAGTDQYGNLMTGANTQSSFALNPIFGGVGANQGGSTGTNIGSTIAGLGSLANAGSNLWSGLTSLFD